MPSAKDSTVDDLSLTHQPMSGAVKAINQPIAIASGPTRSPLMIASLPAMNSGPDGVIRQFNGGRPAPVQRIFVR